MDCANGEELTVSYYHDIPPADMQTFEQIAAFGDGVRAQLKEWWTSYPHKNGMRSSTRILVRSRCTKFSNARHGIQDSMAGSL